MLNMENRAGLVASTPIAVIAVIAIIAASFVAIIATFVAGIFVAVVTVGIVAIIASAGKLSSPTKKLRARGFHPMPR